MVQGPVLEELLREQPDGGPRRPGFRAPASASRRLVVRRRQALPLAQPRQRPCHEPDHQRRSPRRVRPVTVLHRRPALPTRRERGTPASRSGARGQSIAFVSECAALCALCVLCGKSVLGALGVLGGRSRAVAVRRPQGPQPFSVSPCLCGGVSDRRRHTSCLDINRAGYSIGRPQALAPRRRWREKR